MSQTSWLGRSFEELSRRKVVRAGAAYAVGSWVLVQVADTVLPAFGGSDEVMRLIILGLLIGFPIALVLAWVFDFTSGGIKRTPSEATGEAPPSSKSRTIDLVIMGVLAAAVGYLLFENLQDANQPVTAPVAAAADNTAVGPSVAVLPFDNYSDDPNNEIFADGLAEDVLIRLSKIEALRVPGRTSSFKYRGEQTDLGVVGRALNVSTLLRGSVQAYADSIKVTARLVNARDGVMIWSESYVREMTNLFAIQEEIARDVAANLQIKLIGDTSAQSQRPTASIDAYRLYLRGRNEWHKRTSSSTTKAIDLFERAIALDEDFALAWSGLADSYSFASSYGNMENAEAIEKAGDAARRAVELGPQYAEAHASAGLVHSDKGEWPQAAQAFQRAIELNPGFANAHMWLGTVLSWVDLDRALAERQIAADLEPLSPIAVHLYGESLYAVGKVDEARRQYLKVIDFAPEYPLVYFELARLDETNANYAAAITSLQKANELDPGRAATMVALAQLFTLLGDLNTAREWMDRATQIGPEQLSVISQQLAMLLAAGDLDGMEQIIDTRLSDEANFFPAYYFRSAIAFERENYQESADWTRRIFERFSGNVDGEYTIDRYLLNKDTMFGVMYLATSLRRSGDEQNAAVLARRLLDYVIQQQDLGFGGSDLIYAKAGAQLALGDTAGAMTSIRTLAESGYPDYLRMDNDTLFKPIQNELEFRVSVDYMRNNAREQLARLNNS
ncbi:MAG: tetratricopeptide repeat protein [Gammaproteobacteria bacterium]